MSASTYLVARVDRHGCLDGRLDLSQAQMCWFSACLFAAAKCRKQEEAKKASGAAAQLLARVERQHENRPGAVAGAVAAQPSGAEPPVAGSAHSRERSRRRSVVVGAVIGAVVGRCSRRCSRRHIGRQWAGTCSGASGAASPLHSLPPAQVQLRRLPLRRCDCHTAPSCRLPLRRCDCHTAPS